MCFKVASAQLTVNLKRSSVHADHKQCVWPYPKTSSRRCAPRGSDYKHAEHRTQITSGPNRTRSHWSTVHKLPQDVILSSVPDCYFPRDFFTGLYSRKSSWLNIDLLLSLRLRTTKFSRTINWYQHPEKDDRDGLRNVGFFHRSTTWPGWRPDRTSLLISNVHFQVVRLDVTT
jgi:hypothetical protein